MSEGENCLQQHWKFQNKIYLFILGINYITQFLIIEKKILYKKKLAHIYNVHINLQLIF